MERQLIERCKKGDRKAQRGIYDRYSSTLYGCSLRYAGNVPDAQDILQDSFVTIFNKIDQYNHKGSFEGWCKRITINTALQRYRGVKVHLLEKQDDIPDTNAVEELQYDPSIGMDDMLEMVQGLPDRYRMVFSLYALDGYTHKEIAAFMNISEGTSKSNLSRARLKLQEQIIAWRTNRTSDAI